jgi:hypothetical protein
MAHGWPHSIPTSASFSSRRTREEIKAKAKSLPQRNPDQIGTDLNQDRFGDRVQLAREILGQKPLFLGAP